jgi:hypothetical protein
MKAKPRYSPVLDNQEEEFFPFFLPDIGQDVTCLRIVNSNIQRCHETCQIAVVLEKRGIVPYSSGCRFKGEIAS